LLKFYTQYGRFPRGRFEFHVRPYGEVNLDMDTRLNLAAATVPRPRAADHEAARSTEEDA
jgi:hypothetical protein